MLGEGYHGLNEIKFSSQVDIKTSFISLYIVKCINQSAFD